MPPWTVLDTAQIPGGGGELKLSRRADEFSIRLSGIRGELMNSRMHGSEEALAELGCAHLRSVADASVLVGGLGMGFTLAAALRTVAPSAQVTVAELIPDRQQAFDAVLLDVDNGPEGLTHKDNQWLYSLAGLEAIYHSLRPEGVLAVWSAGPCSLFTIRLKKVRFNVSLHSVRARKGKGAHHTIWLAQRPWRARHRT
jgi:spermidine synthase